MQALLGLRVKRYSPRTMKTYCYMIRYVIRFNGLRHPASMEGPAVKNFLERLAVQRYVTAATQNQAWEALMFSIGMYWEKLYQSA
ncbi:site-specific integrase [Chromohalobacter canadensis]|uniref:Site-specific integrase n=1 Tax=Chromohalobacter canadensis TaxID=141389 RepID=A0ABZ0YFB8_9GAMM|nr:site-specific integrase [Chromohalobacter canadensis]MCK0767267.1 phage integrase N-terminal SAM-like domain-containing protein [Chromohalobacter canadensis]WQH10127.1 site-specific integrase [Chromohalobacter canadensis]